MKPISQTYGTHLTRREEEIYALITERGLTSKLAASMLGISEYTIANHRKSILKKKGIKSIRKAHNIK